MTIDVDVTVDSTATLRVTAIVDFDDVEGDAIDRVSVFMTVERSPGVELHHLRNG